LGLLGALALLTVTTPARASVTFGTDLTTGDNGVAEPCSNWTYVDPGSSDCVSTLGGDVNTGATAPIKGVITSFSIRMGDPVVGRLRVVRMDNPNQPGSTTLTFEATGSDVSVPGDGVAHSFLTRLPVAIGDSIAFASSSAIHRTSQNNHMWRLDRDGPDGSTSTPATIASGQLSGWEPPINATIEGDADGDGYGDETQDLCPSMASTHDACPGTQAPPGGNNTPPPAVVPPDTFAPVLSPVTIDHKVFRVDSNAAAAKAPKGATLRFSVSEAGTAHLSIYVLRPGRRSGRRCVAPAPRRSRGKACTKQVLVAGIDKPVVAQQNSVAFPGRVRVGSAVRTLSPGHYRVDVQTRDAAGNASNVAGAAFTVVKR
jgi:hypothetical protein